MITCKFLMNSNKIGRSRYHWNCPKYSVCNPKKSRERERSPLWHDWLLSLDSAHHHQWSEN